MKSAIEWANSVIGDGYECPDNTQCYAVLLVEAVREEMRDEIIAKLSVVSEDWQEVVSDDPRIDGVRLAADMVRSWGKT